jgi:hypothetical protein
MWKNKQIKYLSRTKKNNKCLYNNRIKIKKNKEETKLWKNAIQETLGLKSVLAKGKKPSKNKSRNKKNNFVG